MMRNATHFPGNGTARPAVEIDIFSVWGTSVTAGPIIVQRAVWGATAPATVSSAASGSISAPASDVPAPTKAA